MENREYSSLIPADPIKKDSGSEWCQDPDIESLIRCITLKLEIIAAGIRTVEVLNV